MAVRLNYGFSVTDLMAKNSSQSFFTGWLAFGFAWLLLGMFILPTSKLYQQGLIVFFWLPGLLSLIFLPVVRQSVDRLLLAILLLSGLWAALSILWGGEVGRLKELLYVALAVTAVMSLAALNARLLWQVLLACALAGAAFAWWSVLYSYGVQGYPLDTRLVATGLLDHTILASQVLGVLGLVLLFMRAWLPPNIPRWLWLLACLGYLLFLLMSRSKGPILALLVCLLLSGIWTASLRALAGGALALLASVAAVFLMPEVFLRDGTSYRPELLKEAWSLLQKHPWLGIGNGVEYQLPVHQLNKNYDHAHNLYMHVAVQLGSVGALLWGGLLAVVALRAWAARGTVPGIALCAVCVFSWVALFTDGIGPWVKPREEWFTVWLPILLAFALFPYMKTHKADSQEI
jgi:O-antigen ligase